jgi:hypothetical protein
VRALEVGHGRKTLLPYGVLLILDRKERNRQCGGSGEAVLTQRGEGDVRHHLNAVSGSLSMTEPDHGLAGSKGYHHANLTLVQVVDPRQSTAVDWSVPVVAKTDVCFV